MLDASITFLKISATGNDFILIDNRDGRFDGRRDAAFFSVLCQRRRSIGADGVILLQHSDRADFHYVHVNSDGSLAEMCGNGTRAIVYFARKLGLIGDETRFEINNRLYGAHIDGAVITTEFNPPGECRLDVPVADEPGCELGGFIDTGVPHFVVFVRDIGTVDIDATGRKYRRHPFFRHGTNVDFVQLAGGTIPPDSPRLVVRTYERGVEAETLACGTGAVASSIIAHLRKKVASPVRLSFPGGLLTVTFNANFSRITLSGGVTPVYEGRLIDGR